MYNPRTTDHLVHEPPLLETKNSIKDLPLVRHIK